MVKMFVLVDCLAASAASAAATVGAAAPTKSPSRTSTTSVIAFARESSHEIKLAPNDGGRKIWRLSYKG